MKCHSCNREFEDYQQLALHIAGSKKGHRKGKKWAAKYLMLRSLSFKNRRDNGRLPSPLTAEDRENKRNSKRELSGEVDRVTTFCPQCHTTSRQEVPTEYINSPEAWHRDKSLMILCENCRR